MRADVVDMYHGDVVSDFRKVKSVGVIGIIHKATQGASSTDGAYAARRQMATDAGLLWGAYHFNDGENVATQVQHFLDAAKPDANTLMCLDFEDNRASNMSVDQAADFLQRLEAAGIPRPVIYSGNRAKDLLGNRVDTRLGKYRLWLAQYGPSAHVQASWKDYWLWQFTGDGIGSQPHNVDGITTRGIDINQYNGDSANLAADWALLPSIDPVYDHKNPPLPQPGASVEFTGKMSTFGGPRDTGVSSSEGLAIVAEGDIQKFPGIFLLSQPPGTTGLARRLDPTAHYLAMRWDYAKTPRAFLQGISVKVSANGKTLDARPVDWGPNVRTGRIADLSPGLAAALGLDTDDVCSVVVPLPSKGIS